MATARRPPPKVVLKAQDEKTLERFVRKAARMHGWCGFHVSFSHGAVTGIHTIGLGDNHYDSDGFPDWLFVRGSCLLWRELKSEGKYQTPGQKRWQALLQAAGQDCKVWRPSDHDEIFATFSRAVT